ncbi:hypothetical protein [Chitinimonas sp. BJB300]|uniref:hypothetical protein n=1 Tax=Chitinimonas sp. BJB300 TaxID=1559339 RepID=UPI000C119F81|nr:hypothetical protein [Chitinimonas sp. BJB300]PHV12229.1 hypothetical protein CSQ89_06785 [Chitinimonas sp. BJB300]TSJ85204.1 hypothetical protein FG002_018055 [Chitinimonas sp. BJB300]
MKMIDLPRHIPRQVVPVSLKLSGMTLHYLPSPHNLLSFVDASQKRELEWQDAYSNDITVYVYVNLLIVESEDFREFSSPLSGHEQAEEAIVWFTSHGITVVNGLYKPAP